ncbi:MAG TPA: D-glycero-beta-D-manno-heptose-7-phosphate kinase [Stellaceae bacterium]|jgi:D-beta-D-heptose 7-phosphate kinase/D-beta-D-heptose 1-phosphate adenosyltransferase
MDFSDITILCLGDVMLDQFAYCDTERVSPEAPIPVLLLREIRSMLGGAGNVARNIAALGGKAILAGLTGEDAPGAVLAGLVGATPGLIDGRIVSATRPTTRKTRYLAAHQQIVRVDEESVAPLDGDEEAALIAAIERSVGEADAVILSDYNKGVLTPKVAAAAIARARAAGIPVYVDPKGHDFGRYHGATCLTPNLRAVGLAARMPIGTEDDIAAAAARLMLEAGSEAILVTRSEKGMMLVEASGAIHVEPARAREVFDVSGAGDTVIAVLALARAAGHTPAEAMRLSNIAAGIVVSKLGTATVELDELMLELSRDVRDKGWQQAKHYTVDEAETLVRQWKGRGLKVGFTNGVFDIVHAGHVALLAAARAECDRLIVALNTDASTRRLKGPTRPVNALADRSAVIAALEAVDGVVGFDADTPLGLIERLLPDVLVKGGDYTVESIVGAGEVQDAGGRVVVVDLVEGRSTTATITRLQAPARRSAGGKQ